MSEPRHAGVPPTGDRTADATSDESPRPTCDAAYDTAFDTAFAVSDAIDGWLTRDQARVLWDAAAALPDGSHVVEIGSHRGRSTVVLARALQASGGHLTAVDAFVDGPRYGGRATHDVLLDNLERAGVRTVVDVVAARSQDVRRGWSRPVDLLWVDGKHDYWTCSDDLRWTRHLPTGGRCLVHDAFSSIGVTAALLVHVLPSRRLRLVGRVGSLAVLEVGPVAASDRLRIVAQLPWWTRNVVVKVLLRLRLGAVARRLGHVGPFDPY